MRKKDPMTGLMTKDAFIESARLRLESGEVCADDLSCVYFDIKAFKLFYARNNFDRGYECLSSIGHMIEDVFKGDDICRSSNDHFIVLTSREGLSQRVLLVQEKVHNEWKHTGLELTAGSYELKDGYTDMATVCSNAKMACKSAEKNGDGFSVYDGALERSIRLKQYVIHHFDEAIDCGHIIVYYQPIMHVLKQRLCGYEALARWNSPEYGILMPEDFLDTLKEAKQVHRLDAYMIRMVCKDLRLSTDEGLSVVPVSLNLSRQDFVMSDMLEVVKRATDEFGIDKQYLRFELSEGMLSEDREDMLSEMRRFRKAGYMLGMDDFGGKASSLHILKDMPFDSLKIDSSFVKGTDDPIRSRIILKNMMNMAKELGIETMMSGIDDESIVDFIKQIGCEKFQGNLYGSPMTLDKDKHISLDPENDFERDYYDAIGRVNILSQTPLKTGWSHQEEDAAILNLLPLAIMEFDRKSFNFLMSNDNFKSIFSSFGMDGDDDPQSIFNNTRLTMSTQFRSLAERCIYTGTECVQDFVTDAGYHRLVMRCVSYNGENDSGAVLAIVERMSEDDPNERASKMDNAMRFLYSLYSRVDLISADGSSMDNIYIDTSRYNNPILGRDANETILKFTQQNIYVEDMQKCLDFLNLNTMEDRLADVGGRYMVDYFRTRDAKGNYDWLMYMIVPVVSDKKTIYVLCSRGIDAERMRRLPEISQSGAEYYDMPSNPVYLILASSAFTRMLEYGSFDEFLRNSFFVEGDLTSNLILSLHLGKQQVMDDSNMGHMGIPYDEVIREMITGSAVESDKDKVKPFFDRDRLLSAYKDGQISSNIEYLRLPDSGSEHPRYMNASYQIREASDGHIHIYILTFDVDDYRRTNETIHRLAERDTLTGLYNRSTSGAMFDGILNDETTETAALIILDLDNFKQINDRYGHDCGDKILKDASSRMSELFDRFGYVARIGGDEFLAVVKNLSGEYIDEILQGFTNETKLVDYHGKSIVYTMSIGYALFPGHGEEYNTLYQRADMALYAVKMHGRNSYRCFAEGMENLNRSQLGFNKNSISEEMPGGFLVYRNNDNLDIVFANQRLINIFGCRTMEEFRLFTGNSFRGCVYEEDWKFIQECIDRQVNEYDGYDYVQYRARTKDGKIKYIEDYGRLYHAENGEELFYVFMLDLEEKERNYGHVIEQFGMIRSKGL